MKELNLTAQPWEPGRQSDTGWLCVCWQSMVRPKSVEKIEVQTSPVTVLAGQIRACSCLSESLLNLSGSIVAARSQSDVRVPCREQGVCMSNFARKLEPGLSLFGRYDMAAMRGATDRQVCPAQGKGRSGGGGGGGRDWQCRHFIKPF